MSRPRSVKRSVPPMDADLFAPTLERPLRCTPRHHRAHTEVHPHQHPWAQMVFSSGGVARVSTLDVAYVVPPWRAVWIPPAVQHAATVLENAQLHSVYLLPTGRLDWQECRVIEVEPLLRELILALSEQDAEPGDAGRYRSLCSLTLAELRRAPSLPLGIALPKERRLRAFCESFLNDPALDRSLASLAHEAGASVSTIHRLFRQGIGSSFSDWRQQVLLARALTLAAKGMSMGQISDELGYSSASAFSAMVMRLVGVPPSKLLLQRGMKTGLHA
ncbi:helix-turn-helix transcriptional regulator [Variovorax paradoxus]|nr:helix-turn-helix transcriptional regulator [Variovorax paradoxus]